MQGQNENTKTGVQKEDKYNETGRGRSTEDVVFHALDAVLCNRPTSRPTVILDILAPSTIDSGMKQLGDVSDKTEESHATQEGNVPSLTDDTSAGTPSTSGESEKPGMHAAKGKRK